jgi:Protein of unknown function (DUF3306)
MSEEKQDFLRRWSRLKKESEAISAPPKKEIIEEPVELPALDSLTFESDFKSFMHAKVEESVKRAALKKLFADPRFNVMDGLDTYIDDYSVENPIPDEMMARLDHARQAFFGHDREEEAGEKEVAKASEEIPEGKPEEITNSDGDPAQDPKAL